MTEELINKINSTVSDSWNHGIFREAYGVPTSELVLYKRWESGGMSGGSCWGDSPIPYSGEQEPEFEALDLYLNEVCPNIKFMQYKKLVRDLQQDSDYTNPQYYGNYDDYQVRYIIVSELEKYLINNNLLVK